MEVSLSLIRLPIRVTTPSSHYTQKLILGPNVRWVSDFGSHSVRFPASKASHSGPILPSAAAVKSSSPVAERDIGSNPTVFREYPEKLEAVEEFIEKIIYRCRFMTILGVFGSLIGSFLCFIKGCAYVIQSFMEFFVNRSKVIVLLVEAIDVYLLGTVMLVFGMGLYELFVSNLGSAYPLSDDKASYGSIFFGLFTLKERPKWLDIKTVNELKTKLGHVIVMLLLIGLFDKSKKATINSPVDLLCFSASVLLSSSCLFLLSKLNY
ncbi:UPF0114 domain-containing protein [Quillaja saponaria]|uniref:UPF0114 domain-containing protein n=1 Tax=Quillaja saponaria TaxID=32244 RepID=A0AAD7L833_QUISA|nr:UPF0114 domain-containing protein [Quillaja saponaria]